MKHPSSVLGTKRSSSSTSDHASSTYVPGRLYVRHVLRVFSVLKSPPGKYSFCFCFTNEETESQKILKTSEKATVRSQAARVGVTHAGLPSTAASQPRGSCFRELSPPLSTPTPSSPRSLESWGGFQSIPSHPCREYSEQAAAAHSSPG